MIPYGPTDGHPLNNQWASTEQALGTHCQYGGQRMPNYKIYFGHYYFYFQQAFKENIMKNTCMDVHLYPAAEIIYFLKKQIGSSLKVSSLI